MEQINFDQTKLKIVPIDDVSPNPWNPKDQGTEEFRRVKLSIEKNGLRLPIVVREIDGKYQIVDGEQRWRACKELGYEKVIIYNEGVMEDLRAKELTIWYQQQVPFNEVDLAHLVSEMIGESPSVSVPFSQEELDNFMKMTKFDFKDFEKTPLPDLGSGGKLLTFSIPCSQEQLDVIESAIDKCIKSEENDMTKTRAVELIMADYLAGK